MARRYPWRAREISKSDHFHFVWFTFTNHCYLFEERVKVFYKDWNKARDWVSLPFVESGRHIKKIESRLLPYIKHRGIFTHQHHEIHISYRTFQLIDFMNSHTGDYEEDHHDFYLSTKMEILEHISNATAIMCEEFYNLGGEPHEEIKRIYQSLSETVQLNLLDSSTP